MNIREDLINISYEHTLDRQLTNSKYKVNLCTVSLHVNVLFEIFSMFFVIKYM